MILPGFNSAGPGPLPAPTPITSKPDPAIAEAKERLRLSERRRKGRRATIVTSARGVQDELGSVSRPQARAARLLGGTS